MLLSPLEILSPPPVQALPITAVPLSRAKKIANAQNARHSTGPKTSEGKAKSALNATTHGGYTNRLLDWEDPEAFETYYTDLMAELRPETPRQTELAHDYVWASWRLKRLNLQETMLYEELADTPVVLNMELSRLSMVEVRVRRAREKSWHAFLEDQLSTAMRARLGHHRQIPAAGPEEAEAGPTDPPPPPAADTPPTPPVAPVCQAPLRPRFPVMPKTRPAQAFDAMLRSAVGSFRAPHWGRPTVHGQGLAMGQHWVSCRGKIAPNRG